MAKVESAKKAFDSAVAARNAVLSRIRQGGTGSIPISQINKISERHGAQVTRVIELLQLEQSCQLDFKNDIFKCRPR